MSDLINTSSVAPSISGDHVTALYAQLNRYRAHSGQQPFIYGPVITPEAAYTAIALLMARLASGLVEIPDAEAAKQQQAVLNEAIKNPIPYVQQHLDQVIQTLAIYGDTIGLPSATVGVTTNSAMGFPMPLKIGLGLLVAGLLGWGVYAAWKRSQNALPAPDGVNGLEAGDDDESDESDDYVDVIDV